MENYTNPKNAKIINVKGEIQTGQVENSLLQVGDNIKVGTVLNLVEGSEVILAFDDGSQHRIYSTENGLVNETLTDGAGNVAIDSSDTNSIEDEISAIQDLIDSGVDVDLPETAAGLVNNEGTSFVTLNRTGDETLAQAGYDTTEQNINPALGNDFLANANRDTLLEINDEIEQDNSTLSDNNETVVTAEDTEISGNVLDNGTSNIGPLVITNFTVEGNTYNAGDTVSVTGGELTINADGTYTFTPNDNFNGAVPVISYTVTDGAGDTDISTLTIAVTPVSDLTDGDESVTTTEDNPVSGNILANANTVDGPLTVTNFTVEGNTYNAGDTVSVTGGELTINANGTYTFTPDDNFNGTVPVISYTVTDGAGDTDISTLTIAVTPVSDLTDGDESVTTTEDNPVSGNILANANTVDGPLTVTNFTVEGNTYAAGDTVTVTGGELTINADGTYTFTPDDNFNGTVPVISYTVTDGAGDTDISTLTIAVTPVSDLTDGDESVTTTEDNPVSGNILTNANTVDGPLTVTNFTVEGNTYNAGDTVSVTGGELTINADGTYTFTPSDNFNGTVPVISYTVTDGAGDTDISTLTIAVTPVSDLTDGDESVTTTEDNPVSGNILANANTADGPLTVTNFTVEGNTYAAGDTVTVTGGELTINADGTYTFTPDDNFNGAVPVISYTVTDGAGDTDISTLTIAVTPVSDLTDGDESVTTTEDNPVSGNILANANTVDGPLTVTNFTVEGNTYAAGDTVTVTGGELTINADGTYTFTPDDNFNGAVPVISYTVTDGAGDTDISTLTIAVTPVSDLTDGDESVTTTEDNPVSGNILANANTVDGPLTVTNFTVEGNTYAAGDTVSVTGGELTINADGTYTFTPNDNFNGAVPVVSYTVTDGAGDTDISTLTIAVTPVSDLTDGDETVSVAEDMPASGNVLANANTVDGPLTVTSFTVEGNTYAAGDTVSVTGGELTINANGTYTFTPDDNFNGTVPVISYTVTDGAGDTDISTLTIAVTPVSDLTDGDESVTTTEDNPVSGNILSNANTVDGPLTVTNFTVEGNTYAAGDTVSVTGGELTINADGTYTFIPDDNFNGTVPVISYTVTDGAGDTDISTLTIAVTPTSDLTDGDESVTTTEDNPVSGNILANANTVDGPLTVTNFTVEGNTYAVGDTVTVTGGELTINADGTYTFTPDDNFNGAVPVISYTVTDGAGDTDISTLTIAVTPTSDLTDGDESVTTTEDNPVSGNILTNANTVDGPLTVTNFTVEGNTYAAGDTVTVTGGELTINANGTYTFTPDDNFNGAVPVIFYTVTDGAGDTDISTLTIAVTPTSDLTDGDESVTTTEDNPVSGNILTNANTVDGPLTVTNFTVEGNTYAAGDTVSVTGGELTINANGTYTFTPDDNFNGTVPVISYTVTDGAGDTDISTLTIAVTPVSDLTDGDESVTTTEDNPVSGNILSNANTVDGPLTVTNFTVEGNTYAAGDTVSVTGGELTINADGTYTFIPDDNFNGTVPVISYTVTDGAGDTDISTLTIAVTPVSDLTDGDESVTTTEDNPVSGNVLANANTVDGSLTVTNFTVEGNTYNAGDTVSVTGGELTINADGTYTFTPSDNFNGTVPVISYTVTDGAGDTDISTLTIAVTPVSDLTDGDETVSVAEDMPASGNVLANANTVDGPLTVTSFTVEGNTYAAGDTVSVTGGELTINADGTYTFTPDDNFNGAVPVISYTVTDGAGDIDISTLTIAVTPTSDLTDGDETVSVAEDMPASGNVLANANTVDGPLTVTNFTVEGNTYAAGDTVTVTGGELTINANGTYTFTPDDNFNGAVPVISYTVTDGAGDTDISTLTIAVTPVSDLTDGDETVSVAEDMPASGNVLANANTVDGPLTVTNFTVEGNTYAAGDTVSVTGGELTINANGTYTFTPDDNFNGTVPVISYTVTDGAGDTDISTLTIAVTPVSDLTDGDETVSVAEDMPASGNVLANANTVDGPLTVTSFTVEGNTYAAGDTVSVTGGELTINTDGTYTFTPDDNFNGTVPVISYTVTDGAGDTDISTLTIAVTPTSDLTDGDETVSVAEDMPASGNVLANANTVDGPLTVTSFTVEGNTYTAGDTVSVTGGELTINANGTYTFTPDDNFNGAVPVISYTVTDGAGDTDISTLTIAVTPVSDLTDGDETVSVAEDMPATGDVLANANTVDGPLTVTNFTVEGNTYAAGDTVTVTGGELTINANGTYTFTPDDNFNGAVPVISYTVTDGAGDTDISTLTIAVTPTSDLTDGDETVSVAEDMPASGNVLANANTVDGPLTVTSFTVEGNTYAAGDTVSVTGGELTINTDGTYTFTPDDNFNGAVPVISYTVTDGAGDIDISTLTIAVTPTSDLTDGDETVSVAEDMPASGNVLANANTVDGPLTVTNFTVEGNTYAAGDTVSVTGGELTINANGTYTFTPDGNFNGTVPVISYTVTDGAGDTDISTLTIAVTPVSDLTDGDETVSVAEDMPASGNVLANANTVDGPLTVTSFTVEGNTYAAGDTVSVTGGELTINTDGTYTFTPDDNFNGAVPVISYTVTDGAGDIDISTLTIAVTPTSDLTDGDETVSVAEDMPATGNVLANANTVDGPLTVTNFTVEGNTYAAGDTVTVTGGELTINANGTYTFTPDDNFNGTVPVISYTVTDGAGDTDISTLTIAVTPVSDLTDGDETVSVAEDMPATGNVLANANTVDGPLTVTNFTVEGNTYAAGDTVTVTGGELTINANGTYTFTPDDNFNGTVPVISYTVTDGAGDTDISTLTIAVTPVSDLTDGDESVTTTEDNPVSGNILTNANTVDGPLTVTNFTVEGNTYAAGDTVTVTGGELTINANGTYTFTPDDNFNGAVPVISYTVTDGAGDTDISTLTIAVTPTSDLTDGDETVSVAEDMPASGNVLANANTVDGPLTVTNFTVEGNTYAAGDTVTVTGGELNINANGTYTFTPDDNFNGTVPVISYTVTDGAGDTDISTLSITVEPANAPPIAANDSFFVEEGGVISGNIITHDDGDGIVDSDGGDGAVLVVTHINGQELVFGTDGFALINVDGGTLSVNANGDFTYQNSEGFVLGAIAPSFEYTLSDGIDSDIATVTIAVGDSAPDAIDDSNSISYRVIRGVTTSAFASGNIVSDGSSGDGADEPGDGNLTLTQFVLGGVVYLFDSNTTSYEIDTGYGIFKIDNTGLYSFELPFMTDASGVPSSLEVSYTIQDDDTVNPETDNATLTITFNNTTVTTTSALSDGELIDLSYSESATDINLIDEYVSPAIEYNLSDLLVDNNNESFEDTMLFDELSQSDSISILQETEFTDVVIDESLSLENIEQVDAAHSTETIVTNSFLDKGVTLINDASAEVVPLPIELDSTDHI
ncbi:Ig-like domain-containing protein [Colwellia sp. Arc7-635]|uniref:Ig-like domain-containing protein n=1 Tax=Colwellia sp. Arc7-635 TaxID=2497879 RepID=UPI0013DEF377|nr:Ig-like domain-containing protein [Colwellia sp. Arc7-635]